MQLVQPPTDLLPAGPDLCGPDSSVALCTDVCPDLCAVALCAVALCGCGPAVCSDGGDRNAAVHGSALQFVRLGRSDVLPSPSFLLLGPDVLLQPGFGLLC